jgi:DNA-binding FadR family transcriptional regulator
MADAQSSIQEAFSEDYRSDLYERLTGEPSSTLKLAHRTAQRIEIELIRAGWPVGDRCGSEAEIAERFSVGRRAARESVRILQERGLVRIQRGPGGGMIVTAPKIVPVIDAACDYFLATGVSFHQIVEARQLVNAIAVRLAAMYGNGTRARDCVQSSGAADITGSGWLALADLAGNAAVSLFVRCVDTLFARYSKLGEISVAGRSRLVSVTCLQELARAIDARDADASAALAERLLAYDACSTDKGLAERAPIPDASGAAGAGGRLPTMRAGQVVEGRISRMSRTPSMGQRLGSEFELCELFAVSRNVMREAVRILEDRGVVNAQRGRGRGLMMGMVRPGSTIRMLCSYMLSSRLAPADGWVVCRQLHVELVALATAKASNDDRARLQRTIEDLKQADCRPQSLLLAETECMAALIARNPILDLFFRAMKAVGAWTSDPGHRQSIDEFQYTYRSVACTVMQAICAGNPMDARAAEHAKQDHLERSWRRPPPPSVQHIH